MRPMDGYPDSWGNKRVSVFGHAGPASYTQVAAGTAPALSTGGDTVRAGEGGMKFIDGIIPLGLSDSGTYRVEAVPDSVTGVVATQSSYAQPKTTYRLRWVVVATNAQVAGAVNLSAEIVRLLMIGPK